MEMYDKDHLVACTRCAFVFSNLKPSQEELDKVYGVYSRDSCRTDASVQKMTEIALHLKKLSGANRVIDIGCGDGDFLMVFKQIGCKVFGTEYDVRTEEICRSKGITMLNGGVMPSLDECQPLEPFDLVIFTEVIEHINNPEEVINNISRLLRKDGLLYITTPNFSSLERRILGPQWGMIGYPEHISYYSPGPLDLLLRKRGYAKVALHTENVSIFRIIQFFNKRQVSKGSGESLNPEKVSASAQTLVQNNVVFLLLKKAINIVLDLTSTGSSLIAIYRKVEN